MHNNENEKKDDTFLMLLGLGIGGLFLLKYVAAEGEEEEPSPPSPPEEGEVKITGIDIKPV